MTAPSSASPAAALFEQVGRLSSDRLHREIAAALGRLPAPTERPNAAWYDGIAGFYVGLPGERLVDVHVVTRRAYVRHESSAEGDRMTTLVPVSKIRRVTESFRSGALEVVIEYDAMPADIRLQGQLVSAGDAGGGGAAAVGSAVTLSGALLPGGIVLSDTGSDMHRLVGFAVSVRSVLLERV
jgi:hypothetical protein